MNQTRSRDHDVKLTLITKKLTTHRKHWRRIQKSRLGSPKQSLKTNKIAIQKFLFHSFIQNMFHQGQNYINRGQTTTGHYWNHHHLRHITYHQQASMLAASGFKKDNVIPTHWIDGQKSGQFLYFSQLEMLCSMEMYNRIRN